MVALNLTAEPAAVALPVTGTVLLASGGRRGAERAGRELRLAGDEALVLAAG